MTELFVYISYVFWFAVVLGVAVFFHELGHFAVAKWLGVRVLRFSVGFGRKVWGFERHGTEYWLSLIPLGGYVKMAGDNPEEQLQGTADEFLSISPWKRILIVIAGPAANVITALACFFLLGALKGEEYLPHRTIEQVFPNSPAAHAGLQPGDTFLMVRGRPVFTYNELDEALTIGRDDVLPLAVEVVVSRPSATAPDATAEVRATLLLEDPFADFSPEPPTVARVQPDMPAAAAGIQLGVTITAVNGQPVRYRGEVAAMVRSMVRVGESGELEGVPLELTWADSAGAATTAVVIPKPSKLLYAGGEKDVGLIGVEFGAYGNIRRLVVPTLTLPEVGVALHWPPEVGRVAWASPAAKAGIRPGDTIISIDGRLVRNMADVINAAWDGLETTPEGRVVARTVEVSWKDAAGVLHQRQVQLEREAIPTSLGSGEYAWRGVLGVEAMAARRPLGLVGSIAYAARQTYRTTGDFFHFLNRMITGHVSTKHLAGPIGIFKMSGDMGKQGWDRVVMLIALICVNLALINLFPIPILDGGHILLYTIEAIRGKRWTLRQLEIATYIGLIPIVLLFVLVFYNDLYRMLLGWL